MDREVSESITGQGQPKPSREQRDAAFSAGAGRKAAEVPQEEQERENQNEKVAERKSDEPVGLELETKSQEAIDRMYGA